MLIFLNLIDMRKYLILTLGFIISINLNGQNTGLQIGRVIIAGHVEPSDNSSKLISLSYSGAFNRCDFLTSIIDSIGNFKFEFEILHPIDVLVKYGNCYATLFVNPLDSLFLSPHSNKSLKGNSIQYEISGIHSRPSRDIQSYLSYKREIKNFNPQYQNKSVETFLKEIKSRIVFEDSILLAFQAKESPSKEFMNWAKENIIYSNANYLVGFNSYHLMNKTSYQGELYDTKLFPVSNDSSFVSSLYYMHLWSYSTYKYFQRDSIVVNLFSAGKLSATYERYLKSIIKHEPMSLSRDVMCYQILSDLFKESFNDFSFLSKDFDAYLNNKQLVAILKERKNEYDKQPDYQISLYDPITKTKKKVSGDFLTTLVARNKGKVIFLDFWATWCAPCRVEAPYSFELQKKYQNKPIVFVNICLSSSLDEWEKTISNQQLSEQNYYFTKDQSEIFARKNNLNGYPTYMIIDKVGHFVDRNAPRPSSGNQLNSILNELIEQ